MVIFMEDKVRIDKFLWCVRLFKTRRLANEACVKSKVKIFISRKLRNGSYRHILFLS